jgi:PIN domain nuclease of toxin-antitoxin system
MTLILDTHACLWFLGGDTRLSAAARSAIEGSGNTRQFSIASLWEIAIKVSIGKLEMSRPFLAVFPSALESNGIHLLPLSVEDVQQVATLPFHHRDPFDRILVAQAQVESASLVSADTAFDAYGVSRIW